MIMGHDRDMPESEPPSADLLTTDTEPSNHGPLAGVRIVDLTTVVMGPLATRILGDLGADVIKVESPDVDFMRDFDPKRSPGMSAISLNLQRNKRNIVLNLKSPRGRDAVLDLARSADAFVTNLRPAAMARLGLGPSEVTGANPTIIYCQATGFDSRGPYAGKAAYDDVIQAVSGMASLPMLLGQEPSYAPTIAADKISGLHIVYAILAALYRKATTGQGDVIEVPMAESIASYNLVEHLNGHTLEPKAEPFSYQRLATPHRRPRRSADGWVCILPYSDKNWQDFFDICGRDDLAQDPRFATINSRTVHVDALYGELDEIIRTRSTEEWMKLCDAASIPAVPVVELEHIEDDPHFAAVGLLEVTEHPTEGTYRVVRDPIRFAAGTAGLWRHSAHPGEHTDEVLREVGYTDEQIAAVEDAGRWEP